MGIRAVDVLQQERRVAVIATASATMVAELRSIRGDEGIEVVRVGGDEASDFVVGDGDAVVEMDKLDVAVVGGASSCGDGEG